MWQVDQFLRCFVSRIGQCGGLWLCGTRECSMISTIVSKLLLAQSVLLCKPACMRVAFSATAGIVFALAPLSLLIKDTVCLLSECRQAPERQELSVQVPSWIAQNLRLLFRSGSFRFSVDWVRGVLVALALASILLYLCSSWVEPATLRVRRVRLNHSEDVRSRIVVSFERILGWPVVTAHAG